MTLQETAYYSVLLLFCLSENALGAGWNKNKWIRLFVVAIPAGVWVHAVFWFYHIPLGQIQSFLTHPLLISIISYVYLGWILLFTWAAIKQNSWKKQPSWMGLLMIYPVVASAYPLFSVIGKTALAWIPSVGILLFGLLLLWGIQKINQHHRLALRPFILVIQWILFNHLTPSIS